MDSTFDIQLIQTFSGDGVCYKGFGINHFAKDCLQGHQSGMEDRARRLRNTMCCFRCGKLGHFASDYTGNEAGDGT